MTETEAELDRNGLLALAAQWMPRVLTRSSEGQAAAAAFAASVVSATNFDLDAVSLLTTVLDPMQRPVSMLPGMLRQLGINPAGLSADILRRLAIVAPYVRKWAGTHPGMRSVAGVATGATAVVRPFVADATVLDVTTLEVDYLGYDDFDTVYVWYVGLTEDAKLVTRLLRDIAASVNDELVVTACYDLTSWRDGLNGWDAEGPAVLNPSPEIDGEFLSVTLPAGATDQSLFGINGARQTAWRQHDYRFVFDGTGSVWFIILADSPLLGATNCYSIQLSETELTISRVVSGVPAIVATYPIYFDPSPTVNRRVLVTSVFETSQTAINIWVDGTDLGWYYDSTTRPDGEHAGIGVDRSVSPASVVTVYGMIFIEEAQP